MQSKVLLRWLSFIGGAVILAFSIIVIFLPDAQAIGSLENTASVERAISGVGLPASPAGRPIRLKIPAIAVDAAVESVGLTPDGAMDAPKEPADVAWFNQGPRPGKNGSAVIAGHFGWKDGIPAAFDKLSALQKGDKIYVEDEKGAVTTFVVRELRAYDPNADAGNVFNSSDGKAHLNLITCEGLWDAGSKSYSKRLVVFTDKE